MKKMLITELRRGEGEKLGRRKEPLQGEVCSEPASASAAGAAAAVAAFKVLRAGGQQQSRRPTTEAPCRVAGQ